MAPTSARQRTAHLLVVGLLLGLLLAAVAISPVEAAGSAASTLLANIDDARTAR